jgi:hypothetical protein
MKKIALGVSVLLLTASLASAEVIELKKTPSFHWEQWKNTAVRWFKELKRKTDKWTKKGTDFLSTPLDRSNADSKGAQLAKSMEEASKATSAMAEKNKKINEEIRRQKGEALGSGSSMSSKKGRFTSL